MTDTSAKRKRNILVIYDSDHPSARNNECLQKQFRHTGAGHAFTVELADQVRAAGYDIQTADIFLKNGAPPGTAVLCVTDMVSANTETLLEKGAVPFVNFSQESPIIARSFYMQIAKYAGRFHYNFQFGGTRERFNKSTTHYSTMYFPVDGRTVLPRVQWAQKKFLVLVNANKRAYFHDRSSVAKKLRTVLSWGKMQAQKLVDPWMRSRELYKDRIEVIRHFSQRDDFHLYGRGWENPVPGFSHEYTLAATKAWRGAIPFLDKFQIVNGFKFSICFENCVFPGYVTEKIFDCFLSGCIPIYYGAPDITDFVPSDTFIDYRLFSNLAELEKYLSSVSEEEGNRKLDAARQFLEGKEFDKFYLPNFIENIVKKIDQYSI